MTPHSILVQNDTFRGANGDRDEITNKSDFKSRPNFRNGGKLVVSESCKNRGRSTELTRSGGSNWWWRILKAVRRSVRNFCSEARLVLRVDLVLA